MNTILQIIKSNKRVGDIFKINTHKHWRILIFIFFLIVFLLIIFSFYILYQIKNDQIFQVNKVESNQKSVLKEDLLKKTTSLFETKNKKQIDISNNTSYYNDPSL